MMRFQLTRSLAIIGIVLFALLQPLSASASSLSQAQINALTSGVLYFNTEESAQMCGSVLVGSNFGEQIFNFLVGKGLSPVQAAGLMGNLQAESGLDPARVQSTHAPEGDSDVMNINGHTGYGLAQWTSLGRQQNLHAAAVAAGAKDSDILVQLNYLWTELNGGYKSSTLTPLLAATDIREATSIVMIHFEAPFDKSQSAQNDRAALSIGLLAKYGSSTTPTSTASSTNATVTTTSSGCGDTGSANKINGDFALPVDQSFYTAHKEWFTKPHHDYPAADIPVPLGTKVYSMTSGKIIKAPVGNDCGVGVEIDAGKGIQVVYCHGSDGGSVTGAKQGDTVKAGQLIMHSASTGSSTGPHLHVQINYNGAHVCPQSLLVAIAENQTLPTIASLPASGCTN
jgi:hypothetical protein